MMLFKQFLKLREVHFVVTIYLLEVLIHEKVFIHIIDIYASILPPVYPTPRGLLMHFPTLTPLFQHSPLEQ